MRRLNNQKGLSLVEMLVAVVIMGILAAVTWSTFNPAKKQFRGNEQAGQLDSTIAPITSWASQAEGGQAAFDGLTATVLQKLVRSAGNVQGSSGQIPSSDETMAWQLGSTGTTLRLTRCRSNYFNSGEKFCRSLLITRGANSSTETQTENAITRESYACPTSASALSSCASLGSSGGEWTAPPAPKSR